MDILNSGKLVLYNQEISVLANIILQYTVKNNHMSLLTILNYNQTVNVSVSIQYVLQISVH